MSGRLVWYLSRKERAIDSSREIIAVHMCIENLCMRSTGHVDLSALVKLRHGCCV